MSAVPDTSCPADMAGGGWKINNCFGLDTGVAVKEYVLQITPLVVITKIYQLLIRQSEI